MRHLIWLVGAATLLCAPVSARASGSASLEVVGTRCGLQMSQTFRKILRGGRSRGYFERVRKRFAERLAPLVASLDRRLKKVRGLASRSYDVRLPRLYCNKNKGCPGRALDSKRYPAVLVLPQRRAAGSDRHVYRLSLPLTRPPKARVIARVLAKLQRVLDKGAKTAKQVEVHMPAPVERADSHVRLVLTPYQAVLKRHRQRHEGQLAALAAAALRRMRRLQRQAAKGQGSLSFAKFSPKLPYYEKATERFPARSSSGLSDRRFHLHLQWAYARAADPKRRAAFSTRVRERIMALYTRR